MLLRLLPDSPSAPRFTVVNGSFATGYTVLNSVDWGNAVWQHAYSGARGTQGARPVAGEPDNRVVTIPIRIGPSGSVDATNLKAALLCEAVDELRRFGGQIQWQASGQTPRQYLEVMEAGIIRESWAQHGAADDRAEVTIVARCAPYMLGDPMDTLDDFSLDSIADYTRDNASGSGSFTVAGGLLVPSATGLKRYRHTAKAYQYGDGVYAIRVRTGPTITSGVWGVTARADVAGADTLLAAEIVAGTNVVRVSTYIAGTQATIISAGFTPAANTSYWVTLRLENGRATASVYPGSSATPPVEGVTAPSAQADTALTLLTTMRFGAGHAGIRANVVDAAERYGPFIVKPFTYVGVLMPERIRLTGTIPGDARALATAEVTVRGGTIGTPIWGLVSWLERPAIANMIWNGDFEDATIGTGGWLGTAVTGIVSGTTTLSRITTASLVKYGAAAMQAVTPATTGSGPSFAIQRRFRAGRAYAILAWLSSAAGTTSIQAKLGINGDLGVGPAANLSTTPKLYAAVWQPVSLGEIGLAYAAITLAAATGTTFAVDGACVVESPIIGLSAGQGSTTSTTWSVYGTPSDIPALLPDGSLSRPFYALVDFEIIRVTAISSDGLTWTADRGQEGTTAVTHGSNVSVIVLPPLRPHLEGKGAVPAFDIVECDSYVPALSSAGAGSFSTITDSTARGGQTQRWTPGASGAQLASYVYFIDPNTLTPDDYTQGEIDVEIWLRHAWAATLTSMRVTVSAQPEGGTTLGPERVTREFTNVGKLLWPATAKVNRVHRIGSIPMIVDQANPQRWRLKLALACTGGAGPTWDADYLMLIASRARLASPTGEQNDTASALGAYPDFIPYDAAWGASSAMTKIIRPDGSSLIAAPGGYAYPDSGFGDVLEVPDGDVDFLVKLSNLVPDDPTLDATSEGQYYYTTDVHLGITPRYTLARGS